LKGYFSGNRVNRASKLAGAQYQYVEAHIPSSTNAFTSSPTVIAVQASTLVNGVIRPVRMRFVSVTMAMTVATGAMKRNHNVKISARFK